MIEVSPKEQSINLSLLQHAFCKKCGFRSQNGPDKPPQYVLDSTPLWAAQISIGQGDTHHISKAVSFLRSDGLAALKNKGGGW